MGNCLVTKLKASVNNDSLIKLGKLTLLNKNTQLRSNFSIQVWDVSIPTTITVSKGDNHIKAGGTSYDTATDYGQSYTIINSNQVLIHITPGANAVIDIDNIENVKAIAVSGTELYVDSNAAVCCLNNIDSIHTLTSLETLQLKTYSKPASVLVEQLKNNASLKILVLNNCTLSGRLSDFAPLTGLEMLQIAECVNMAGDIRELGGLINLETLYMHGIANYTGSLEGFVQAQRAAGRTTNNTGINFVWLASTSIKFDGKFVNLGDTPTLTWTANTITLSNTTGYSKTVNA